MNARLKKELTVSSPIGRGISAGAKLVQEYLNVNGIIVTVDGDWGPATAKGLDRFRNGATAVDQALMDALAQPLLRAIRPTMTGNSLADAIVGTAVQNMAPRPIEIGGQNAGPWVRHYMDGHEGPDWPWCMGFVTSVLAQAAAALGGKLSGHLIRTYSCDVMGGRARDADKLVRGTSSEAAPGCVFLVPGARKGDWIHTGIIIDLDAETFSTIEGNTNDAGSREGFKVCSRIRHRDRLDVVLI